MRHRGAPYGKQRRSGSVPGLVSLGTAVALAAVCRCPSNRAREAIAAPAATVVIASSQAYVLRIQVRFEGTAGTRGALPAIDLKSAHGRSRGVDAFLVRVDGAKNLHCRSRLARNALGCATLHSGTALWGFGSCWHPIALPPSAQTATTPIKQAHLQMLVASPSCGAASGNGNKPSAFEF